ncbi:D-alanyl-D-alanine carboxypeptidase/D-alanyl-D-alanine-endopeptidase [Tamilnaduibacter salinus]|uniref:D-alanyl-D-alanine carboxypeptidase/D-alanyl-D-alanine-endopeptidase n=1 Tax=Tamilnaduibacter salinus TaxID=1484056 RepID=A0A2A2I663_9GAMM|nr:D-alanyl-D-alanine carboxypeptidase/D-alanyl-D-alanine-endopeptidase [Tamilnaduibacter salinus]PAV27147.1 D-alanyl-D-alanine carboxypeptidase/D-alanyl-D-alanine-endopeptidase [Tamilnaduibacter salinus]
MHASVFKQALITLLCLMLVPAPALAGNPTGDTPWKARILDATLNAVETKEAVSIAAVPMNGPGLSQFINADQSMSPGSIMKLITTFAALETLGPAHHWETRFLTDGRMVGNALHGNLYVTLSGDPRLDQERLWSVMRELHGMGIRTINGDLVLDGQVFQLPDGLPAFDDKGDNPYAPFLVQPSPYLTNFNLFHFQVRADERGTHAWSSPSVDAVRINNQVTATGDGPCPARHHFDWTTDFNADNTVTVTVEGELPKGCRTTSYQSLLAPEHYTAALIRSIWKDLGGRFTGISRTGTTPEDARLVMTTRSKDLVSMVRDINKWSNNVMARQLLLMIGAAHRQPEDDDDREAGIRVVHEWLASRDIDTRGVVIDNGAGLSRESRISARQGARILEAAWQSPFGADLIASMPLIATDGTMAQRLRDTALKGKGRIKTGYLRNVRSIAGFTRDENNTTWAVIGMVNHAPAWNGQALLDKVLYSLYHKPPSATTLSRAD